MLLYEQRQRAKRKGRCEVASWNEPPQPRASGGGDLLKVEDGKTLTLAVVGNPERVTLPPGNFPPKNGRPNGPRRRVFAVVYVFELKAAKVWDMASSTFEDAKAVHKEAPFDRHALRITRTGTNEATTYSLVPVVKPLTPEALAAIKAAPKPDLERVAADLGGELERHEGEGGPPQEAPEPDEENPF